MVSLLIVHSAAAAGRDRGNVLFSVNPLALASGMVAGTVEILLHDFMSIYVYPAFFTIKLTQYSRILPDVDLWSFTTTLGAHYYPGGSAPVGPFVGGGIIAGYFKAQDTSATVQGPIIGIGFRIGVRWIRGNFALAPNASMRIMSAIGDYRQLQDRTEVLLRGVNYRFGLGLAIYL